MLHKEYFFTFQRKFATIQMNANNELIPFLVLSRILILHSLFLFQSFDAMKIETFSILNLGVLISENKTYRTLASLAAVVS